MLAKRPRPSGLAGRAAFWVAGGAAWTSMLAMTVAALPASAAQSQDNQQILDRLNHLDQRVGTLENAVKDRDAKIQTLENAVHERDATIESLKRSAVQLPQQGAAQFPAPAAGGAQPPSDETQRIENLERTVRQLNEITNAQQEQIKPSDVKVTTKGGLKVETTDGQFSFQPIGRLNYDAAWFDQDKSRLGDGMKIRRARLGVTGTMFGDWQYRIEPDFANNGVSMAEAWIKYVGWAPFDFAVGNVPVPFGLEQYTSDLFTTFIERALPSPVFAPERLLGFGANYFGPNYSFSTGLYGPSVATSATLTTPNEGDHQFVSIARATYEPVLEPDKLIHFGIGFLYNNPNNQPVSFSTTPESAVTGVKFLNTGNIANVGHFIEIDPELSLTYGPVNFEGEYFFVPVTRTDGSADVDVTGWYGQLSYFLTGESRNYNPKIAKFDRVSPIHNAGKNGWGAFELAARMSNLDLDGGPSFQFGNETDYTIGLNWYPNPYIRFMANYVWVRNNASALGNAANLVHGVTNGRYDDPSIFEFRAQVDF